MRFVTPMIVAGFLATACGAQHKSDNTTPTAPAQTSDQAAASLPAAAVVRVPLDANGQPAGNPEMHTTTLGAAQLTGSSLASAFDAGAAPQKVVASKDELDGNTSTQSWSWGHSNNNYGWGGYNNYGGYNNNYGYGYNNNSYGYGYGYTVYYGGYNYGYGYNSYYGNGGYGYYSYCR